LSACGRPQTNKPMIRSTAEPTIPARASSRQLWDRSEPLDRTNKVGTQRPAAFTCRGEATVPAGALIETRSRSRVPPRRAPARSSAALHPRLPAPGSTHRFHDAGESSTPRAQRSIPVCTAVVSGGVRRGGLGRRSGARACEEGPDAGQQARHSSQDGNGQLGASGQTAAARRGATPAGPRGSRAAPVALSLRPPGVSSVDTFPSASSYDSKLSWDHADPTR
jgi:hypothetical protein